MKKNTIASLTFGAAVLAAVSLAPAVSADEVQAVSGSDVMALEDKTSVSEPVVPNESVNEETETSQAQDKKDLELTSQVVSENDEEAFQPATPSEEELVAYHDFIDGLDEASYYFFDLNEDGINELVIEHLGVFAWADDKIYQLAEQYVHPVGGGRAYFELYGSFILQVHFNSGSGRGTAELRYPNEDGSYDVVEKIDFDRITEFDADAWVESVFKRIIEEWGNLSNPSQGLGIQTSSVSSLIPEGNKASNTEQAPNTLPATGSQESVALASAGMATLGLLATVRQRRRK